MIKTLDDAFIEFMEIGCLGLSSETVRWYRRRLRCMVDFIGPEKPINEVTLSELLHFRAYLESRERQYGTSESTRPAIEKNLSPYTVHSYIRTIKRFFKWLVEVGILETSPTLKLKLPKLPKKIRNGISEDELQAILEAARLGLTEYPERDYALLCFLEATACRRAGAANLRLGDIDLESGDPRLARRAWVREKGDKERVVFLDDRAWQALKNWIRIRPSIDDDHVFLARSLGQAWHAITAVGIAAILKRYKNRLGLNGRVSPHQWRHRWARKMLQSGMDVSHVSMILGHEDVSTTVRFYGGVGTDELQQVYDRARDNS
jgi:site-specific recombinase XerD